ncbi:MAG: hypothetical protein JNK04_19895, partial [Myxococcales bacterium]|nr:hypothetical protein [Myxococcales bacterium]
VLFIGLPAAVGLSLRLLPVLSGIGFVVWFIVKHAGWQANRSDLLGERRELIRQGRMLKLAWAWYVVPLMLPWLIAEPVPLGSFMTTVFVSGGIFIGWTNYREGKKLIDAAHA